MNKNILLTSFVIVSIGLAMINSQIAKSNILSWSANNLNSVNFICLFVSLIAALILIASNNEKKIWVYIFASVAIIFNAVFIILGYLVSNFGF